MSEEIIDIVPMPPLVSVLLSKEREKGELLTEAEVIEIRDKAVCMAMSRERHLQLIEKRGYADIDPANVWSEWQKVRTDLKESG